MPAKGTISAAAWYYLCEEHKALRPVLMTTPNQYRNLFANAFPLTFADEISSHNCADRDCENPPAFKVCVFIDLQEK